MKGALAPNLPFHRVRLYVGNSSTESHFGSQSTKSKDNKLSETFTIGSQRFLRGGLLVGALPTRALPVVHRARPRLLQGRLGQPPRQLRRPRHPPRPHLRRRHPPRDGGRGGGGRGRVPRHGRPRGLGQVRRRPGGRRPQPGEGLRALQKGQQDRRWEGLLQWERQ